MSSIIEQRQTLHKEKRTKIAERINRVALEHPAEPKIKVMRSKIRPEFEHLKKGGVVQGQGT